MAPTKYLGLFTLYFALMAVVILIGRLALTAFEYEQSRFEQLPEGCVVHEDGSATCRDEDGGWHFEQSPWKGN